MSNTLTATRGFEFGRLSMLADEAVIGLEECISEGTLNVTLLQSGVKFCVGAASYLQERGLEKPKKGVFADGVTDNETGRSPISVEELLWVKDQLEELIRSGNRSGADCNKMIEALDSWSMRFYDEDIESLRDAKARRMLKVYG